METIETQIAVIEKQIAAEKQRLADIEQKLAVAKRLEEAKRVLQFVRGERLDVLV